MIVIAIEAFLAGWLLSFAFNRWMTRYTELAGKFHDNVPMTFEELLEYIGTRFLGMSLESRRHGTDWPHPWRLRIVASKNERDDYRQEFFGATPVDAVLEAAAFLHRKDTGWKAPE